MLLLIEKVNRFGKTQPIMKAHLPTYPPTQGIILSILMIFALCSCDKKIDIYHQEEEANNPIELRSVSNEQIDWLIDFQFYLYDLQQEEERTNIYSLEKAVNGIEALLNIRYANSIEGRSVFSQNDTITVLASSDWLDLFESAHNNLLNDISARPVASAEVAAFDMYVDTIIGTNVKIITKTLFDIPTTSSSVPITCEAEIFDENEEYYLWLGGTDVYSLFLSNELDCENECGTAMPGSTAAMEEIQNHINISYPEPDCGPGRVWTKKYINVDYKYSLIEWSYNLFQDCGVPENQTFNACDCLDADILNCMLCTIYDEIDTYAAPIRIPENNYFISIDLGVDFIYSSPIEEAQTRIDIKYFFGVPVCAMIPVDFTDSVLTMDLEELKCC